jgi:hypothetical protein
MRKVFSIIAVVIIMAFIFLPLVQVEGYSPAGTGELVGWVSPSFAFFQCGVATGAYLITVPSGSVYGRPEPFWVSNSVWNCEYPHL